MAISSSFVTATKPTTVEGYKVTVPSTVNTDTAVVNDKANTYYNTIRDCYTNMKTYFQDIGKEFVAAKKNVTGEKLKGKLQKAANACTNQGTYCGKRKEDLETAFEFAKLESRVRELELAVVSFGSN